MLYSSSRFPIDTHVFWQALYSLLLPLIPVLAKILIQTT
jgi:hypothetical protein